MIWPAEHSQSPPDEFAIAARSVHRAVATVAQLLLLQMGDFNVE
jgi:hypothetical protein